MAFLHDLTTAQLKHAVQIREQIESLQAKLDAILGGAAAEPKAGRATGKRTPSAANKKKTAAVAKSRGAKGKAAPVQTAAKKKGGITAAGRAKLSAAMRARWAARKKGAPAPNASAN